MEDNSIYDSLATANARAILGANLKYPSTISEWLSRTDVCIVALPSDEFKKLEPSDFAENVNKGAVVLDCWRLFKGFAFDGIDYVGLGRSIQQTNDWPETSP